MRLALASALAALALTACGDRRSFDERYSDTDRALTNEARALDANLAAEKLESGANSSASERPR